MRAGLSEAALTVSVSASFVAPVAMPVRLIVRGPESSVIFNGLMGSKVGGSLTGLTITLKVRVTMLLLACPSRTLTEMVAKPDFVGIGVNDKVAVAFGLV